MTKEKIKQQPMVWMNTTWKLSRYIVGVKPVVWHETKP